MPTLVSCMVVKSGHNATVCFYRVCFSVIWTRDTGSVESWRDEDDRNSVVQYYTSCVYLARATRILHPPLKSFSFFCCIAVLKPKPWRIREARISALSASSSSRRSYSSISFSHSAVYKKKGIYNTAKASLERFFNFLQFI